VLAELGVSWLGHNDRSSKHRQLRCNL
jgi:hypothetical protein